MVAMVETREGAQVYIGEIDPAALPLTVMLFDSRQTAGQPALYGKVKLAPLAVPFDNEPTWEDAAWQ